MPYHQLPYHRPVYLLLWPWTFLEKRGVLCMYLKHHSSNTKRWHWFFIISYLLIKWNSKLQKMKKIYFSEKTCPGVSSEVNFYSADCSGSIFGLSLRELKPQYWFGYRYPLNYYEQNQVYRKTGRKTEGRIVIYRKHFIKYWPVWFEHCGYMWHICLPNASQSHVIRPIGWFNIVYQARHHLSLKRFQWKCHAENVFKNVLVQIIWSVYGWIR